MKEFFVPRVYCDELIEKDCQYLDNFNENLNNNIVIFYCGKKIISDTNNLDELKTLKNLTSNKILFWDNLYANDYCPKKIFIGPYFGRLIFNDTLINPTGLIRTDLFILDLIKLSTFYNDQNVGWNEILKKYRIPKQFSLISKYFFPINFKQKNELKQNSYDEEIEALDFLLWRWKTALSREWYQYFLILKQDLQMLNGDLKLDRITKIFPIPLKEI